MEDAINHVILKPVGIAGLITPWNLPLYLLSWKIAPAIVMGNTVVAKPSELTPLTANLLAEVIDEVGLPAGVVNIVHGSGPEAGQAIVEHPEISLISFTGGTETGRKVASFIAGAGVGYLVAGRDSKRTTKSQGTIVVTNKAIYCAGNKFEFDNILAMTKKGTFQKKIHLTLDKTMATGGEGGALSGNRISVEIEIQTDDIDGLFKGLENARMSGVEF